MLHVRNFWKTLISEMFSVLMVTHPSSGLASLYRNGLQVTKQKGLTAAIRSAGSVCTEAVSIKTVYSGVSN